MNFYDIEDCLGDDTILFDPMRQKLNAHASDHTLAKFHRSTLEKMKLDLRGYLSALRKLPNNAERKAMLYSYDKSLIPALKEILESEGLL